MNEQLIKINVLLFGACREAAGTDQLSIDLAPAMDVAGAFTALSLRLPQLADFRRSALFAVNEEHVRPHHLLHDGDTLAIFPPVSGG